MTSKEIEKMKNEEVLEILLGNVDYKDYSSETMRLVNSCVSRLWEILERLEALEKENVELQLQIEQLEDSAKIRMQQIDKYATTLTEKYLDLIQENEKLKKKLNIYEKYTGIYYDKETKEYYIAVDCEFGCKGDVITKNEFEVLKND